MSAGFGGMDFSQCLCGSEEVQKTQGTRGASPISWCDWSSSYFFLLVFFAAFLAAFFAIGSILPSMYSWIHATVFCCNWLMYRDIQKRSQAKSEWTD
jgi:hypothetical protein